MKISEHIGNTLEAWSLAWKDRLRGWMTSWLALGIEVFFDVLGKAAAPKLKPFIDKIEATGEVPPELQPLLDELKAPKGQVAAMFANSVGGGLIGGALGRMGDALFGNIAHALNRLHPTVPLGVDQVLALWLRGELSEEVKDDGLAILGYPPELRAWLTKLSEFIPFASIITEWVAKEVYEPDMVERYGLDSEFPTAQLPQYWKAGVSREQALNFWRAHWEHPSWTQITEMLHRGHLTPEQVYDWYRLVEIPPGWRDLLTKISYAPYTRVDARRMWDMGVLEDDTLLTAYKDIGYDEEHALNMVLWTKVYVTFPDLIARYRNGWIDKETVLSEITALGMKPERAQWLFETKFKKVGAERTAAERDLTKTDIVKGVKKGVIERAEGLDLLIDMGYDELEAEFILEINIPHDEEEPVVKTRELTKADILTGLKTAIMTEAEAQAKLEELRYTPDDAKTILEIFKAAAEPPVEAWQREASKADIVAAVKKGLITAENAYLMLLDIGFSAEAANFILMVRAEVSPFSPINYEEFKKLTQTYRRAQGLETEEITPELLIMKRKLAQAYLEGGSGIMEQKRLEIDTIRRRRRKALITRSEERTQLLELKVPPEYVEAIISNDDARLVKPTRG